MKRLLLIILILSTGCGEDEESYSLWDDLINGVWVILNEDIGNYNAVDFMDGGSVVIYDGSRAADNCIQNEDPGLFVLEGNELTLKGGSVNVEISDNVLTVNEDGSIFTYGRYTDNDFEALLSSFCP